MPQVQSIRRLRRNGESVASIARKTHVSEPTVRRYLAKEDLSAVPSVRKPRASVIDPYLPVIEQWLAEDRANWRKQRHTATRIWERLRDEHGAEVSLSTVTRAVARLRREFAAERDEAFMDLVWHPGEAQADFGEVDVLLRGVVQRMHHFVLDFPYSNVGLVQLMPGENAECTCLALRNLFEWLGGVPERIVFDNAAGVGHKGYGECEPRLTHLFQAFQAHYGFDCSFCNPYSGHEKGAVESKVGMVRRKLFVPRPSVWSLENFNAGLPDRCLELATKPHYRKDTEERGLFSEDRAALVMRLRRARDENRLDAELRTIGRARLLVVDELGYLPIDIDGARLLFQVIADSYEKRSVVFTTNLEFGRWGEVFGDGDMAAAVIDRIVHHGRIVRFRGESYRNSHSLMR